MKKWMFLIAPAVMMGVFLVLYFSHMKDAEERDRIRQVEVQKKLDEERARKAAIEEKARKDADDRAKKRAEDEARKEAEKAAKWKAQGDKIQEDTDKANAELDQHTKKFNALELELNRLRQQRETSNREYLELAKAVERAQIDKRNAELEIQRLTEMVSRRAADSALTRLPAPVTPPPAS